MLAGVAGGLANYLDVDPTIVRLLLVLLLFVTGPLAVVLYIVCGIIIPREPTTSLV
jgi:phage shock protein PspC (stress-responsive transcriptional regulator)